MIEALIRQTNVWFSEQLFSILTANYFSQNKATIKMINDVDRLPACLRTSFFWKMLREPNFFGLSNN